MKTVSKSLNKKRFAKFTADLIEWFAANLLRFGSYLEPIVLDFKAARPEHLKTNLSGFYEVKGNGGSRAFFRSHPNAFDFAKWLEATTGQKCEIRHQLLHIQHETLESFKARRDQQLKP